MRTGASNKQTDFREDAPPTGKRAAISPAPSDSGAHLIPKSATQAAAAMREDSSIGKRSDGDVYLSHGGEAEEKHSALEPMPQTSVVGVTARRDAHLFDEHGLKLVLGSTARPVFTREELAKFNAVLRGEYP